MFAPDHILLGSIYTSIGVALVKLVDAFRRGKDARTRKTDVETTSLKEILVYCGSLTGRVDQLEKELARAALMRHQLRNELQLEVFMRMFLWAECNNLREKLGLAKRTDLNEFLVEIGANTTSVKNV